MRVTEIPGFDNLSQAEKILLAEEIWHDIASDPASIPVPESHIEESDRRVQGFRSDPGKLLTLEELEQRVKLRR